MAPNDVGVAVAIEVGHPLDLPGSVRHGPYVSLCRLDGRAIHEIQIVPTGNSVAPEDIGFTVAVEVAHADHPPVEIGHAPQISLASIDAQSIHRVQIVLASARV